MRVVFAVVVSALLLGAQAFDKASVAVGLLGYAGGYLKGTAINNWYYGGYGGYGGHGGYGGYAPYGGYGGYGGHGYYPQRYGGYGAYGYPAQPAYVYGHPRGGYGYGW